MKVLIAGFSAQSATAIELVIGSLLPGSSVVRMARNGLSGLPEQSADAQECDACILDLLGLGLVQRSAQRDADVHAFLRERSAILFAPTGSVDAWREAFPASDAGQPVRLLLEHPATAVSLREALATLKAATARAEPASTRPSSPALASSTLPASPPPRAWSARPAEPPPVVAVTPSEKPEAAIARAQPLEPTGPATTVVAAISSAAPPASRVATPAPTPAPVSKERPALPPRVKEKQEAPQAEADAARHVPPPVPAWFQELAGEAGAPPTSAASAPRKDALANQPVLEGGRLPNEVVTDMDRFGETSLDAQTLPPLDLLPANRGAGQPPPAQEYLLDERVYQSLLEACPVIGKNPFLDLVCRIVMRPAPSELRITTRTGAVFFPRENWVASNISTAVRKRLTQHEMMLHVVQVHTLADHQAHDHAARLFGRRGAGPRALDAFMWSLVFAAFEFQPPTAVGDLRFVVQRFPQFAGLDRMPELFLQLSKASIRKPQSLSGLIRAFPNEDPNLITLFVACTVLAGVATVTPSAAKAPAAPSRRHTSTTSEKGRSDGLLRSLLDKLF